MAKMRLVANPTGEKRLGDTLTESLGSKDWTSLRVAVAFAKRSGVKHLIDELKRFAQCAEVSISIGIDCCGTTYEGLKDIFDALRDSADIFIYHNENPSTFHPKIFLFKNAQSAHLVIGSGNLTEGGLFTNCEIGVSALLDLDSDEDKEFLGSVESTFDEWSTEDGVSCIRLTSDFLEALKSNGYLGDETSWNLSSEDETVKSEDRKGNRKPQERLFARKGVPPAPRIKRKIKASKRAKPDARPRPHSTVLVQSTGFLMTLQQTDVGVGQTTRGTSRRSPEIFIPLGARDHDCAFWGYPDLFLHTTTKEDRSGVKMNVAGNIVPVNMMCWLKKRDFRLRSEALRSAGQIDDILKIEIATDEANYDYEVEIITKGTDKYKRFASLCRQTTRNSKKKWGYY